MLSRPVRRDGGFTLIELVITIAIIGIVMTALVGTVFAYVRNSNETSTRLNESTDQQFVSAYWQQDVSSLGMYQYGIPPNPGGLTPQPSVWRAGQTPPVCAPPPSSEVITFAWNDYQSTPVNPNPASQAWTSATTNWATYYAKTATPQVQLWRMRCTGAGAASQNVLSDMLVARYLTAVPTVKCYDRAHDNPPLDCSTVAAAPADPFPATVEMALQVQDLSQAVHDGTGYGISSPFTLTAQRRQG